MKPTSVQSLAGILEPVFAIRREDDLGIGDTEGVRQMIDWCARHGLNLFQTLPINETGDEDNSPYNPISSLAIEPATLAVLTEHLPDLPPEKFHKLAAPKLLGELRGGPVDYPKVKALKRTLLQAAYENFLERHYGSATRRALQFSDFRAEHRHWLSDYVLFRVLMEENGNSAVWERWPDAHQTPLRARAWVEALPEKHRAEFTRRQLFFAYVQWIACRQWQALKAHGETKKVYLMGDIPFGAARFSADVWANRSIFDLDWSGGAPPEKIFKTDPVHRKVGTELGHPELSLGRIAAAEF